MGKRHLPLILFLFAACASTECRADPSPSCSLREEGTEVPDGGERVLEDEIGALTAGRAHACIMLDGRDARCWGDNSRQQLSVATNPAPGSGWTYDDWRGSATPAAGDDHTCIYARREVSCWGNNDSCQLGTGDTSVMGGVVPIDLPWFGENGLEQRLVGRAGLTSGAKHTCAVEPFSDFNRVWCWGENELGQLGTVPATGCNAPSIVPGLPERPILDLESGRNHSCVLVSPAEGFVADAEVWCWGDSAASQTGPSEVSSASPVPLPEPPFGLALGGETSCALVGDPDSAGVYCWGRTGERNMGAAPVAMELPEGVVTVTVGEAHLCARTRMGTAYCWGDNQFGQVGAPSGAYVTVPEQVAAGEPFDELAAGGNFTCGITATDEILCWGDNSLGQLGRIGESSHIPMPTTILIDSIARP